MEIPIYSIKHSLNQEKICCLQCLSFFPAEIPCCQQGSWAQEFFEESIHVEEPIFAEATLHVVSQIY